MSEISTGGAPAVSVIIPVYNCAAYLPECLDSVIAQTESSWEIICVDDGSTDDSVSVLREYERRLAGKMRVVEQENAGCACARNRAIPLAWGSYLMFLDADDFLAPRCFELALDAARRTNAQIVVWDLWFYNNQRKRQQHPPLGILHFAPFDFDGQAFSWKRSPDDFLMSFQTWAWNKLFLASLVDAERIATVGERLISYRVMRAGSAMATKDRHAFDFVRAIHSFRSYLADTGRLEALSRSYATWAMSSILYNLNTLASYSVFCEVYRYLADRGLSDLGLADLGEHDFLDPIYYARMREISECDPAAYLFGRACSLDAAREDALAVLDEVSAARDEALAERDAACAREAAVRADLDRVVSEFDAVMGAAEQRVGQAICRLPRAIQRKVGASKR